MAVKFNYVSRAIPIATSIARKTQKYGSSVIWRGHIDRMHPQRASLPYLEGGLGLIDIVVKSEAMLLTKMRQRIEREPLGERYPEELGWLDERTRAAYGCTGAKARSIPIASQRPAWWKKVNSTLLRMREHEMQNARLATSSSIYQFLLTTIVQPPKIDVQDVKIKRLLRTTRSNTLGIWARQTL